MKPIRVPLHLLLCSMSAGLLCNTGFPAGAKGSLLSSAKYKVNASTYKMDVDSVRYTYSGGRFGDLKTAGGIPFDSSISYPYTINASLPTAKAISVKHFNAVGLVDTESNFWSTRTIRIFNAAGNPIQCDFQSGNSSSKTWQTTQRQYRHYNVAGLDSLYLMMIWDASTSSWQTDNRSTWSYNAGGKMTSYTIEQWNSTSSSWDGVFRYMYSYNSVGLLIDDKLETWSTSTSSWVVSNLRFNTYNGSFMTTQVWEQYFNNTLNAVDSTEYVASGSPVLTTVASTYRKSGASGTYRPSQRITTVTNPAGNLNAYIWERGTTTGWINHRYTYFAYNSDHQLVREYMEAWDGTGWTNEPTVSYETLYKYGSPTGISSQTGARTSTIELAINPVPASGTISLRLILAKPQGYEATIADMSGRQCRNWTGIAKTTSYTEPVSIADLMPGVYHLTVTTRDGQDTRAFVVR
jgi:hypothetical protein